MNRRREVERSRQRVDVIEALLDCNGVVARAARQLGYSRTYLFKLLRVLNVDVNAVMNETREARWRRVQKLVHSSSPEPKG